jgi:hypothetical protein
MTEKITEKLEDKMLLLAESPISNEIYTINWTDFLRLTNKSDSFITDYKEFLKDPRLAEKAMKVDRNLINKMYGHNKKDLIKSYVSSCNYPARLHCGENKDYIYNNFDEVYNDLKQINKIENGWRGKYYSELTKEDSIKWIKNRLKEIVPKLMNENLSNNNLLCIDGLYYTGNYSEGFYHERYTIDGDCHVSKANPKCEVSTLLSLRDYSKENKFNERDYLLTTLFRDEKKNLINTINRREK